MNKLILYFLSISFCLIFFIAYFFTAFLLGYAGSNSNTLNANRLYYIFVCFHLILYVGFIIRKDNFKLVHKIASTVLILTIYLIIALIYRINPF